MSYTDEVLKTIEAFGAGAAEAILNGPRKIALFVIEIGLDHLKSKQRRERRRALRREIRPKFKSGAVAGSIVLTKASKVRLLKATQELFGDNGWQIGDLNLRDFTREQLLTQASNERASAKGSLRNAVFYEALAEPMQPGQKVAEFWKVESAHKVKRQIWSETRQQQPTLG